MSENKITHSYDEDADMHYVDLGNSGKPKRVARSIESMAVVDLDSDNKIVGFEIFGIRYKLKNDFLLD